MNEQEAKHRTELQDRNTELVEENRKLKIELSQEQDKVVAHVREKICMLEKMEQAAKDKINFVASNARIVTLNGDKQNLAAEVGRLMRLIVDHKPIHVPVLDGCSALEAAIILKMVEELHRAESIYPNWSKDIVHRAAKVSEESGELTQACNDQHQGDPGKDPVTEATQTGAMCMRFLKYDAMDREEEAEESCLTCGEIHDDFSTAGEKGNK